MSLQPLYKKIRGITDSIFGFSQGNGAQIKSVSSTTLEVRDNSDSTYGIMRGASPVGGQDYTTKSYVDSTTQQGAIRVMKFQFSYNGSNISTTSIPGDAVIFNTMLKIETVFSNPLTQITVGRSSDLDLIMSKDDNDPVILDTFVVEQITDWGSGDAQVIVTITNPNEGTQTGYTASKLIDSLALFVTNGVQNGDTVINKDTLNTATVTNVDSETQLSLSADIFNNYAQRSTGTNTSVSASKLIDSNADFITDGVALGDNVLNITDNSLAQVVAIDSPTQLSLSSDIFTAIGKSYSVFYGERYEVNQNSQGNGLIAVMYSEPES